ncbi:hypothetical protein G6O67_007822 [Ophiocordyceps sinensis]|uniref:Cytochrome P450 n=1 Tax=Ophiocordyceps sinensis TaxID=72228 RepID=A0A8H4LUM7_9HYPO|nr:hypothetical protein G6O67_007822 [Ophiocordyceps sinensis]
MGLVALLLGNGLCAATLALVVAAAPWLWLHRRRQPTAGSQLLPAWVPLEIGISSALLRSNGLASYLLFLLRRRRGSLFGLTSRHQILYNLPSVERLLAKGHDTIDTHPLGLSMLQLRLHGALGAFYCRLQQYEGNQPVDFGADMSDVSLVARQRNDVFERFGVSTLHRGMVELGTLWGQNANAQPLIFWFALYIYSTPGLLEALRAEIDYAALGRSCPPLKSALLETFRLANEPTSIRYVSRPVTVPDGEHSHHLHPGTWISAPHAGLQRDGSVFPDPDRFVPDRFLELDEQTGRKVPRYGKLKPWGAGVGICKGRTFAEKEMLGVIACFITLWDMEPSGGGTWTLPGFVTGTGVMRPKEAVNVVIKRRVFCSSAHDGIKS